jgi:cell division protein FtsI (penicillin-binding protein 3)
MEAAKNRRRLIVLTIILSIAFVGLGCRLVDLQWKRHQEFARTAEVQHEHFYYREAPRGDIRDRRGNLLATSTPVKRIVADPSLLKSNVTEVAAVLAPLLNTNAASLVQAFSRTRVIGTNVVPAQYVVLRNKVPLDDWDKIRAGLTNYYATSVANRALNKKEKRELYLAWHRAVYTEEDQIRTYPNGQLASHVLGFVGFRPVVANGRTNSVMAGAEGIEATLDDKLHGARGWVKTQTDSAGRELFVFREQDVDSRPGLNAVLTIDARVQQIVEEELAATMAKYSPKSASAIVVRPQTGEILAMASLPSFDPNRVASIRDPWLRRNRLITDTFEPGSTFKTIVLAGALNDNTVDLHDMFDCENGYFFFAGYPLRDHEHYGIISVEQIIAKSSNIGTAKVAMRMGKERAFKYIWDFGFGQRTGIPLGGESPGLLLKPKDWKPIHITRIPIGQGVAATPLQMAMAISAVANGGVLMRPMLVDSLVDDNGRTVAKYEPQTMRRVVSKEVARETISALKTVVQKGTADKAALEHYTVAGKTGTAQKVVDRQYSHEKYYSSFIGFFPADEPELCILVALDEPVKKLGYYGGQVAAPAFKRIAERTANFLNIKPDILPVPVDEQAPGDKPIETAVVPVRAALP